ncbi:spore coat protein [Sedimentibacter sp. SX930]|nr:spore coat protein [Sedimentibacter sp. SX930]
MKIAIITSGYLPVPAVLGGAVESLDDYLINENEKNHKCEFEIFTCYHPEAERIVNLKRNTNAEFTYTPLYIRILDKIIYHTAKDIFKKEKVMSYRYIFQRLHFISDVSKKLADNEYDKVIIENHASLFMVLKKRDNAKKYKERYYYHLHNEQRDFYGCEDIIRNCKKIMTVSSYISNSIKKELRIIEEKRIEVLRNCVNISRFGSKEDKLRAVELRKKYDIQENDKVVLFTGRLSPEKGIQELLLAFKQISDLDAKLVIAGGYLSGAEDVKSDYEKKLLELASSMMDRIIFTGFIGYDEMPSVYLMADIVVVPSIWNDPAPLTVIETISSGIPLITTNSGGITEYANSECAIILERNEMLVENLTKSIEMLLSDSNKRYEMSYSGKLISREWTVENYFKNFMHLIID